MTLWLSSSVVLTEPHYSQYNLMGYGLDDSIMLDSFKTKIHTKIKTTSPHKKSRTVL